MKAELIKKVQDIKEFIVIDIETMGFFPGTFPYSYNCSIIEIAAVKYKEKEQGVFEEIERFEELVDPKYQIPKKIIELTGITQSMVTGKRTIGPVIKDFRDFIGDLPLVAHNAPFEKRFLDYFFNLSGYRIENDFIDSCAVAKITVPSLKSKKLGSLADYYGISLDGAHRALNDVLATFEVFVKLRKDSMKVDLSSIEIKKEEKKKERTSIEVIDQKIWEKNVGSKKLKRLYAKTSEGVVYFDYNAHQWHYKNFAPSNKEGDIPSRDKILDIVEAVKEVISLDSLEN